MPVLAVLICGRIARVRSTYITPARPCQHVLYDLILRAVLRKGWSTILHSWLYEIGLFPNKKPCKVSIAQVIVRALSLTSVLSAMIMAPSVMDVTIV